MCLLLKEKSPSNKDEIGFFPCIAVHTAPLLSRTVSGRSRERGDGSIHFVCSGKAASQGMLDVQGQAQRLKDKLRSLYTLCHPWPQQHRCPLGSWAPGVVGNVVRQLSPCCPFPPAGTPQLSWFPHVCQAIQQPVGLEGVSTARCLAVQRPQPPSCALGGGQHSGCMMGRVVPSAEDGRKHPVSHGLTVASLGGRKKVPKAAGPSVLVAFCCTSY